MKFMFDCDDTLYDLAWPFIQTVEKQLPEASKYPLRELYVEYRKAGDEVFDKLQNNEITVDESGVYRVKELCKRYNLPITDEKAVEFQNTYKSYQRQITMEGCFKEYFQSTSSTLAILTNGENSHQRMKLEALKVFDYIPASHIYTSDEIRVAKPNPQAFLSVIDKIDQDVRGWFYIGDNYVNDMQGAKAAGLSTIYFNRNHQKEGDAADYIVYSEQELVDLLQKLEKEK